MKTHTIKTPTAELLIVELPKWFKGYSYKKPLLEVRGDEPNLVEFLSLGRYELLGKPDEIREEDAKELVERIGVGDPSYQGDWFVNYQDDEYMFETAKESLLSLIESEVFWENPVGNRISTRNGFHLPTFNSQFEEAEQKTFDKNRTLIFVKN